VLPGELFDFNAEVEPLLEVLVGKTLDSATVEIAVDSLKAELDPLPDLTHSPETKRHLATVLARRLLSAAHASRSAIAV
jgi:carbon-monoxide dehydrogenase medium subunit